MSKRVFIIVEGQTEEAFVREMLQSWFAGQGIHDIRAVKIQTSPGHKGGFVNYDHLKNDIVRLLRGEGDVVVTTLVDYFRIPSSVPQYHCVGNRDRTNSPTLPPLQILARHYCRCRKN